MRALALLLCLCACEPYRVARVYHGEVRQERFIGEAAYADYLRGAELEARGDTGGAVAAYREATEQDPDSVEAWTRIGALSCATAPQEAQAAFDKAEQLQLNYSGLWRARAECAERRGQVDEDAARRAFALDPGDQATALLYARALAKDAPERAALLLHELALRRPGSAQVWRAVEKQAAAQHDEPWRSLAQRRAWRIESARDVERRPPLGELRAALIRKDREAARRIAVRMRLPPLALAALAIVEGEPDFARAEALRRLFADRGNADALFIAALAADLAGGKPRAAEVVESLDLGVGAAPTALGRLALAELLCRHAGAAAAAAWLKGAPPAPSTAPPELIDALRERLRRQGCE